MPDAETGRAQRKAAIKARSEKKAQDQAAKKRKAEEKAQKKAAEKASKRKKKAGSPTDDGPTSAPSPAHPVVEEEELPACLHPDDPANFMKLCMALRLLMKREVSDADIGA